MRHNRHWHAEDNAWVAKISRLLAQLLGFVKRLYDADDLHFVVYVAGGRAYEMAVSSFPLPPHHNRSQRANACQDQCARFWHGFDVDAEVVQPAQVGARAAADIVS